MNKITTSIISARHCMRCLNDEYNVCVVCVLVYLLHSFKDGRRKYTLNCIGLKVFTLLAINIEVNVCS